VKADRDVALTIRRHQLKRFQNCRGGNDERRIRCQPRGISEAEEEPDECKSFEALAARIFGSNRSRLQRRYRNENGQSQGGSHGRRKQLMEHVVLPVKSDSPDARV
jgi:hypothetical protein